MPPRMRTNQQGEYFSNTLYLAQAVLLQICGAFLIGQFHFVTVALGVALFLLAFLFEFLEFMQPRDMMRWIQFWTTTAGRGAVLSFLSLVASFGNSFIGMVCLLLVIFTMVWRMIVGQSMAPLPILGSEEVASLVEESRGLMEERTQRNSEAPTM